VRRRKRAEKWKGRGKRGFRGHLWHFCLDTKLSAIKFYGKDKEAKTGIQE
jgi:hypothetical protein